MISSQDPSGACMPPWHTPSCFQGPPFKMKSHLQSSSLGRAFTMWGSPAELLHFPLGETSKTIFGWVFLNDFLIAGNLLNHFFYRNPSPRCSVLVAYATRLGWLQLPASISVSVGPAWGAGGASLALRQWAAHLTCAVLFCFPAWLCVGFLSSSIPLSSDSHWARAKWLPWALFFNPVINS